MELVYKGLAGERWMEIVYKSLAREEWLDYRTSIYIRFSRRGKDRTII